MESSSETYFLQAESDEDIKIPSDQAFVVRLDGRSFSRLTQNLNKPFDSRFTACMKATAKKLLEEFSPKLVHTGSDEMSLYFPAQTGVSEHVFGGRKQKILSVMAGLASAVFAKACLAEGIITDENPHFDARILPIVDDDEAAKYFVWREKNTKRNSVSMACRSVLSHKEMQGLSTSEQITKMAEHGIDWGAYDKAYRRGTLYRKESRQLRLTPQDIAALPEKHTYRDGDTVTRTFLIELDILPLQAIDNLTEVLFEV